MPPPDGRNPLPDVWIVQLDPATIAGSDHRTVATVVTDIRRALGSLPRVDAVMTDDTWVSKVDGLWGWWAHDWPLAFGIVLTLASGALACVAFLAGKALRNSLDADPFQVRVLAIVGTISGMVSLGIAAIAYWGLLERLNVGSIGASYATWAQFARVETLPLSAEAFSAVLIIAIFALIGGRRTR